MIYKTWAYRVPYRTQLLYSYWMVSEPKAYRIDRRINYTYPEMKRPQTSRHGQGVALWYWRLLLSNRY